MYRNVIQCISDLYFITSKSIPQEMYTSQYFQKYTSLKDYALSNPSPFMSKKDMFRQNHTEIFKHI